MTAISLARSSGLDDLLADIDESRVVPVFQPIVDLESGTAFAYELLSRGPAPFRAPLGLFDRARELGLTWELDRACRLAAVSAIAALPPSMRTGALYFINISPDVFNDARFVAGFTLAALQELGIRQTNVVIEITERVSIVDYTRFEAAIRHYAQQGFNIALDDFGSGHSGLVTLISCVPHYLKLDMAVTRGVHRDAYKQMIVKSMVALAENVGAVLIAEGVESWDELAVLMRYGVACAQGFLLGRPATLPQSIDPATTTRVQALRVRSI
jgi:EAL domain-containing protein (putative c-di-GMP-specific phosphodiesterase class I)